MTTEVVEGHLSLQAPNSHKSVWSEENKEESVASVTPSDHLVDGSDKNQLSL